MRRGGARQPQRPPPPPGAPPNWGVPEPGAFPFNAAWWRNYERAKNGEFPPRQYRPGEAPGWLPNPFSPRHE